MSATTTISRAAEMMGISRGLAYSVVGREGELAGVPVIRVGRRLLIPTAPFREALGLDPEGKDHDEQTDRKSDVENSGVR